MNLFSYEPSQNILPYDGTVNYFGAVIGPREAENYLETLLSTVPWRNDEALFMDGRWSPPEKWRGMAMPITPIRTPEQRKPR